MRRIFKVITVAVGLLLMAGSAFAPSVFALEAGVRGMYWGSTISGDGQTEIFRGKFSLNGSRGKVQ